MLRRLLHHAKHLVRALAGAALSWWLSRRWRTQLVLWPERHGDRGQVLALGLLTLGLCTLPWHSALAWGGGATLIGASGALHAVCLLVRRARKDEGWLDTITGRERDQHQEVARTLAPWTRNDRQYDTIFCLEWKIATWLFDPAHQRDRQAEALNVHTTSAQANTRARRL